MSGEGNVVAFNVLWKLMVGIGVLALGCASVLYAGQMKLDTDKLDVKVFDDYKVDQRQYLVDNNEHVKERFDDLDDKIDDGFKELKMLIEVDHNKP